MRSLSAVPVRLSFVEFPLILSAETNRIMLSKDDEEYKIKNSAKRVGTIIIITLIMFVRVKLQTSHFNVAILSKDQVDKALQVFDNGLLFE